jgi:hypothetical protein
MKNVQLWEIQVREMVDRTYRVYASSPDEAKEQLSEGIFLSVDDNDASIEEIVSIEEVTDL